MQTMIIMRGLPGSGKSTLARRLAAENSAVVLSTDEFWVDEDGVYQFDPERIGEAHVWNQERCEKALSKGHSVIVDNCNATRSDMRPYEEMARRHGVETSVMMAPLNDEDPESLFHNNAHDVPYHVIMEMKDKWEP